MPIITPSDLGTNIYPEIIAEITRANTQIVQQAVDAAIAETKLYLSRYDLLQLFGDAEQPPTIEDEYLKTLVKDLACWHLIRLSGTGIDYTIYRTAYQDAIASLKNIQSGQSQPPGWPYLDTSGTTPSPSGDTVNWNSNPKRNNFY